MTRVFTFVPRVSLFLLIFLLTFLASASAQSPNQIRPIGRADSLRGELTPLRTCYDLTYYHLQVDIDPATYAFHGSNLFKFKATTDFQRLQFDLFSNLKVEKVLYQGKELPFTREYNAVFVDFPTVIPTGKIDSFSVAYSSGEIDLSKARKQGDGMRLGAFVYAKDSHGKPWISTSCQGLGASAWWPNKDHQADEVDSILISITVPKGFVDVSNGRLRKKTDLSSGKTRFDWFVSNPISNYCVSANIGDYVNFTDSYPGEKGKLDLSFWVLKEHYDNAKEYFPQQVKAMLQSHEHWYGPYPFYEDSYKLVDAPYSGMEHQSAVTYGNGYALGYLGKDISKTGWGMLWDFIIVHESGHEWFGNNLTAKDVADMWIQEGFTNYSEALYIDYHHGKRAAQEYAMGLRAGILNDRPVQGVYNVQRSGSKDMYHKGGVLLNMVRTIINDDEKWRTILRGLNQQFYHQTVTYDDVVGYITEKSGLPLRAVFDQYIKHTILPTLEIRTKENTLSCRWISEVPDFAMPIRVRFGQGDYFFIQPKNVEFLDIPIPTGMKASDLEVDTFNYYIGLQQNDLNIGPKN